MSDDLIIHDQSVIDALETREQAELYIAEQAGRMQAAYVNIGQAMRHERDHGLYRDVARTWEDYCPMVLPGKCWQYDHTQANRLINASIQALALPPGTPIPTKESQLRVLRTLTKDANEQAAILQLAASIGGITTTTIKAASETLQTARATGGLVPTFDGASMTNAAAAASIEAAEAARRAQQHIIDAARRRDELAGRVTVVSAVEFVIQAGNADGGLLTLKTDPACAAAILTAFRANRSLKFWLTVAHAAPNNEEES